MSYELISKETGEVVLEHIAYAPLEAGADPRWYVIRNKDTGVVWDDWTPRDEENDCGLS